MVSLCCRPSLFANAQVVVQFMKGELRASSVLQDRKLICFRCILASITSCWQDWFAAHLSVCKQPFFNCMFQVVHGDLDLPCLTNAMASVHCLCFLPMVLARI